MGRPPTVETRSAAGLLGRLLASSPVPACEPLTVGALLGRLGGPRQVERGVDQRRHGRRPAGSCRLQPLGRGSYSSASRPRSLRMASSRSNSFSASSSPADRDVGVGQPEAAGEERAFARRQAVVAVVRCCSAGRSRRPAARARSPSTVPMKRGSSAVRKPTCGEQQQAGVEQRRCRRRARKVLRSCVEALARRPRRGSRSRISRHRRPGRARPCCSTRLDGAIEARPRPSPWSR